MKIALFDFDGTIIKTSAVLGHCGFLVEKGIISDTENIYSKWENDMKNESLIMECAEFYKNSIVGLHSEDLCIDEYVNQPHEFYPTVIDKIEELKAKGFITIVISGSLNNLIQGFVKKLGMHIGYGAIYGTDIMGRFNGNVDIETYKGDVKKSIIDRIVIDEYVTEVIGFGDTGSDIPIAMVSDEFFLVEPNENTRKLYYDLNIDYTMII